MVLSACERDDLIITCSHWEQAKKLIDDVEGKLSRGLSSMGRNPYSSAMYSILEYIEKNGPVEEGIVLAYFFNDIPIDEQHKIFKVLKVSGQIQRVDGNPPMLRMKKK